MGESLLNMQSMKLKKVAHSVALKYKVCKIVSKSIFNDSTKLKVKWSDIL